MVRNDLVSRGLDYAGEAGCGRWIQGPLELAGYQLKAVLLRPGVHVARHASFGVSWRKGAADLSANRVYAGVDGLAVDHCRRRRQLADRRRLSRRGRLRRRGRRHGAEGQGQKSETSVVHRDAPGWPGV
jgi:hypothetical protein